MNKSDVKASFYPICQLLSIVAAIFMVISLTGCGLSVDNITDIVNGITPNSSNMADKSNARESAFIDKLNVSYYVYNRISEEEKVIYDELYNAINYYDNYALLSTTDVDLAKRVYNYVLLDHPELFWIDRISFETVTKGNENNMYFKPGFIFSPEEIIYYCGEIESYYNTCMMNVPANDAYSLSKYFYEYVIENTAYNENVDYDQMIISAVVSKKSVCAGYAKLYQYLLQRNGIECALVTGRANQTSHAWNIINLDGEYYYTDTTWGDMDYTGENTLNEIINYSYLNVTAEEISKTHTFDNSYTLEECTSINDNYYVREGFYVNKYSPNNVISIIQSQQNNKYATIKCADETLYNQVSNYLIDDGNIMDYTNEKSKIQYIVDDDLYIMTFGL